MVKSKMGMSNDIIPRLHVYVLGMHGTEKGLEYHNEGENFRPWEGNAKITGVLRVRVE